MITPVQIANLGYDIAGDLYETNSNEILLVLIGSPSNKAKYQEMIEPIVAATGMSALVIDYSGHGASPFSIEETTPAQNFLEVVTAFDWIASTFPGKKISVMGSSYGGFMATQLTKYRTFEKLILRAPAIYQPSEFYTKQGNIEQAKKDDFRTTFTDYRQHPLLARAANFEGKTLVVQHELDTVCPHNTTQAFADAFNAELVIAKGFKHGVGESDVTESQVTAYRQAMIDWLNTSST